MFFLEADPPGFNEREYTKEFNRKSSKNVRLAVAFGLVVFNLYLILDYVEVPELFTHSAFIRLAVVTPIVVGLSSLLGRDRYLPLTRGIVLGCALVVGLATVYLHWCRNPEMNAQDPIGIVFTAIYVLAALRMRQREAIIFSGVLVVTICALLTYTGAPVGSWFSYLTASAVTCGLGIGIAHMIENSWRENFAQKTLLAHREAQAASLLEMVFPVPIAERLKAKKQSIAEFSGQVSVLFADIQGFTNLSEKLSPTQLVSDLDAIFSKIDQLCALHGCEKIKTIGDAYLAVSGVPMPGEDHAARIVGLALALQSAANTMHLGGHPVKFRIGIHSGPVVAGVIGKSRFSYDLWGDTVNTASRMESSAPANSIQISEATAALVSKQFELQSRGEIPVRGKGLCKTWLVVETKKSPEQTSDEKTKAVLRTAA